MSDNVSKLKTGDGVYDKIVDEYKIMDDAPYRLDFPELRHMQKMEHALDYILKHLEDPDLSMEEAAARADLSSSYFEREFKRYFEMPFARFVTRLRIRQYARNMLSASFESQPTECIGFSTAQSFSRAFHREIGISSREFRTGEYEVPDMPDRVEVEGVRFHKEYKQLNALRIKGALLDPPHGNDTYYMDTCAYCFTACAKTAADAEVGAWWYFPDCGMKYVFGEVKKEYSTVYKNKQDVYQNRSSEGQLDAAKITIQGGSFAVYSYDRPDNDEDIPLKSRILMRYIFKEWLPVNQKHSNTLGCTYEVFGKDRISIMIPLASGAWTGETLKEHKWSIARWAEYIDEHMTDGLSLESLAFAANYSPQNYRDLFLMYYGITPTDYIRRRRACLALNELQDAEPSRVKGILKKYHFRSREQLDKTWKDEFGDRSDEQARRYDKLPNLIKFYDNNKDKIQIRMADLDQVTVALHSISQNMSPEFPTDIVERILYWFNREFKDIKNIESLIRTPEQKVFLWGNDADMKNGYPVYKYYVGVILNDDAEEAIIGTRYKNYHKEVLPGGKYAEFSVLGRSDQDRPKEKFQFLTRMAFGGWINRNRWRVDFGRRTFILWRSDKMYFYVPVMR